MSVRFRAARRRRALRPLTHDDDDRSARDNPSYAPLRCACASATSARRFDSAAGFIGAAISAGSRSSTCAIARDSCRCRSIRERARRRRAPRPRRSDWSRSCSSRAKWSRGPRRCAIRSSRRATSRFARRRCKVVGPATPPAIPVARARNENLAAEELRLRHRFLDLRRPELQENIILRHRLMQVDAALPERPRLLRDRDADSHEADARGRARLSRAEPRASGRVLRAAAVAAAL